MPPERLPQQPLSPTRNGEKRQGGTRSASGRPATGKVVDFQSAAGMVWRGADYPLLTPGKYQVRGTTFQGPMWVRAFHRWSLRIEFALTMDTGSVSAFYNLGNDKEAQHIGRHSRYYQAWVVANGGHPAKGERMTPERFLEGQFFEVEVQNCDKDSDGNLKPDAEVYSRVTKIISARWP